MIRVVPQDDEGVGAGAADGDVVAGALEVQPRQEGDFFLVLDQEQAQRLFAHGAPLKGERVA